jgi:ABC-type amino acid transport substrate-binding protein
MNKGDFMKSAFHKYLPIIVASSMILTACVAQSVIAAPAIVATPTIIRAVAETKAPPLTDDVWDRIMKDKKIVVGTSWDYPPFSSVNPDFQVVGFDIALIQEVGRRLNIPLDIQNYPFEGLPDVLQINQIDLAIAAISNTSVRTQQMSFSPVYYITDTAILARNDTLVPNITDFNQLVNFRVGVQRGSVFETMVQSYLVDSGKMSAEKLLRYMQTDEAVRDLIENRVDTVVTGKAGADYYGSRQDLKVVGAGFQKQNLVIAMRTGTPRLNAEIAKVVNDMLKDGTIQSLTEKYIQNNVAGTLSTPIPANQTLATLLPSLPTLTPPVCVNGMKFVEDITIADNNMKNPPYIKPGESFVKIWRVKNTGTCNWTPNYHLVYAYGNVFGAQMNGQRITIPLNVAPGQVVDLTVNLVAPQEPMVYQGFWQMETDTGSRFGQAIWVAITTNSNPAAVVNTSQPSEVSCEVANSSPTNGIKINGDFDASWTIKNTSGGDWAADSVDYRFVSGAKMHNKDSYDLGQTVKDGESVKIIIDMVAPGTPGTYSSNWAIVSGSKSLCTMSVSVNVIK